MHQPSEYTFFVKKADNKIGRLRINMRDEINITIIEDLQPNEPVRVEYLCGKGVEHPQSCRPIPDSFSYWRVYSASKLTIHLHSVKEIDGAGWNHGKNGRGMTTVVE